MAVDDMITYKAAPDRTVLDPKTNRPIPDEGITVSIHDPYWWRKWSEGDVFEETSKPAAKAAAGAPLKPATELKE
jgi:hypothetical protein